MTQFIYEPSAPDDDGGHTRQSRGSVGRFPQDLPALRLFLHNPRRRARDAVALYNDSMRPLTLFGLFAVAAMLVFYALEARRPIYVLGFAAGCALASVYGFLQGAWPFGVVEAIWVVVALRRWRTRIREQGRAARIDRG